VVIRSFFRSWRRIFYACHISVTCLSSRKLFHFLPKKMYLYLVQLSNFLNLRRISLRYDKRQQFVLQGDMTSVQITTVSFIFNRPVISDNAEMKSKLRYPRIWIVQQFKHVLSGESEWRRNLRPGRHPGADQDGRLVSTGSKSNFYQRPVL
jgi:hypothetical protein